MYCLGQKVLNPWRLGGERSPFLFGFWQEKTNEDSQMVVGGNFTAGARCARCRRDAQQGGTQVAALSTGREISTQGIDPRLFPFAACNKKRYVLLPSMKLITVPLCSRFWWLSFCCCFSSHCKKKPSMNHYASLCARETVFWKTTSDLCMHSWAEIKTRFGWI